MDYEERYKKFSKNNLPQFFWDKERDTIEYIYYNDGHPSPYVNLYNALEQITWAGFYYPYICKYITSKLIDDKYVEEVVVDHNHSHDFDDVVKHLYYSPESFRIEKEDEKYYSEQELQYLKDVQKYLLFIGLKDVETNHIPVSRYRNKLQKKYANVSKHTYTAKLLKLVSENKIDFVICKRYGPFDDEVKKYQPKEYRALVKDENGDFKLFVEYTYAEPKLYKEVKDKYQREEFKDDDKIVVLHLKVLERFD